MPQDFKDCVKNGGKVRTKNLKGGKYIHICYDKNGKGHSGEVMVKKNKKSKASKQQQQINESKKLAASLENLRQYFNSNYRI